MAINGHIYHMALYQLFELSKIAYGKLPKNGHPLISYFSSHNASLNVRDSNY